MDDAWDISGLSDEMADALCERFAEIQVPPAFLKLPERDREIFMHHRGWFILVRREGRTYMRIVKMKGTIP